MKATREYTDKEKEMIDTFLPDDFKFKKSYADITLVDGKHNMWKRIAKVKPMPKKNKYDVEKYATVDYENNVTLGHFLNKGYNECIDDILGEKDE